MRTKVKRYPATAPLALTGLTAAILSARPAGAQGVNVCKDEEGNDTPCLRIDIPTVKFTPPSRVIDGNKTTITVPFLAQYISGVYQYGVYAAMIVAGAMAVIGGFQWLTGGDSKRVGEGKERITNAVVGMVLVLGAYTILATVDPTMVKLGGLNIDVVAGIPLKQEEIEDYGDTDPEQAPAGSESGMSPEPGSTSGESGDGRAKAFCNDLEDCREKCLKPNSWPSHTEGMMDPKEVFTIPDMPGVVGNGEKASQNVIDGLRVAGVQANIDGLQIEVASGYRTFRNQMRAVCERMGNPEREKGIGHAVAWPGGSNHGAGYAVDLRLRDTKTGKVIVLSGNCDRQTAGGNGTAENSERFNELMFSAGFRRYAKEIWHYELGGNSSCRCDASTPCPAYPPSCLGSCR